MGVATIKCNVNTLSRDMAMLNDKMIDCALTAATNGEDLEDKIHNTVYYILKIRVKAKCFYGGWRPETVNELRISNCFITAINDYLDSCVQALLSMLPVSALSS